MPNTFSGNGTLSGVATITSAAVTYALGDTGPGGGIIFYDAGSSQSWGRFMESAPKTGLNAWVDVQRPWSTIATTNLNGFISAVGTGLSNTLAIINADSGNNAANTARAYRGPNNLDDWFLPSQNELLLLSAYGGLGGQYHWSSTGAAGGYGNDAYYVVGSTQNTYMVGKDFTGWVRPIRWFN